MNDNDIIRVFNENKDMLFSIARKGLSVQMFDNIAVEKIVDDLLLYTLKATQAKAGFNDDTHILKYLIKALKKNMRMNFFIRRDAMLKECKISLNDLMENYKLAKDIINKNRSKKN